MNLRSSPCIAISIIRTPALLGLRHANKITGRDFRAEHPGLESHDRERLGVFSGHGARGPDRSLIWVMDARVSDRLWSLDELVEQTSV
jgi:hypothetical protein